VPTYAFGLTDVFTTKRWYYDWRKRLQKQFSVVLPFFHGRAFLPLPYQKPITVVVGQPIRVPPPPPNGSTLDPNLVADYHRQYVVALQRLYDQHKEALGYGDRNLELLAA
jgi:hypothetical protein